MGEIQETILVAPTMPWVLWRADPALVILEDLSGLPNSLLSAIVCRIRCRPYLVWGLGRIPHKKPSVLRWLLGPVIDWFYGHASGFIGYSSHACAVYRSYGKPAYLARNAALPAPTTQQEELVDAAVRSRGRGPHLELGYIGALTPQKRVDVLLEAVASIRELKPRLHLIGEGSEEQHLRALARRKGIEQEIVFHGALYDDAAKWEVLKDCELGVLPGRGGLAIQEFMSYGVPVVSGVADGTERDTIEPGRTGFLIEGVPTANELRQQIVRYAALSPSERRAMGEAAAEKTRVEINADRTARAFVDAILTTLEREESR
jgi:glycosyltransferase involved in cell wall biosynthesis